MNGLRTEKNSYIRNIYPNLYLRTRFTMERKIIHIDMDAFYASVEQRDNPDYRGKPLVVGRNEQRGVVAAASYEARTYGIYSAMSSVKALQLCPHLIFATSRMDVYKSVSQSIHAIFHEYTDTIEPLSLDEAFLDVTENKKNIPLAIDIAKEIKAKIKSEFGLIASAGVSYNKFLAKIASDYRKPDGLYVIHPEKAEKFIAGLPIESFWGVGKVTARKMHKLGIHSGQELREFSIEFLTHHFGKNGTIYYNFARGIDTRPVEAEQIRKSVGCENTFETDLQTEMGMIIELYHIVTELVSRLNKSKFYGHTLTLKIKFYDFSQKSRSISVGYPLYTIKEILPLSKQLLKELYLTGTKVRLIGLTVSNPMELDGKNIPIQLSFDFQ